MLRFVVMAVGAFLIGLSKAGFGGGTAMIVAPLLALVMPPKLGLGLMLPLLFATDVMALVYYRGQWDRRSVAVLLPPALLGIVLGGYLLQRIPGAMLARLIGLLALGFSAAQLSGVRRQASGVRKASGSERRTSEPGSEMPGAGLAKSGRPRPTDASRLTPDALRLTPDAWGIALGFTAGVTSTLAHLGGLLTTIYLLPQELGPAGFVATSTVLFFCMNAAKLPAYYQQGLLPPAIWHQAAALLPALAAGVGLGFTLNGRVAPRQFNTVVIGLVLLTGLYLVVRPPAPHAAPMRAEAAASHR